MWPGLRLSSQLTAMRLHSAAVIARMKINTSAQGPFNWVAGQRSQPVDNVGEFDNVSPRTGKLFCKIPSSGKLEVDRAVGAARSAFPGWAAMSGMERGRLLTGAASIMRENLEDIGLWSWCRGVHSRHNKSS